MLAGIAEFASRSLAGFLVCVPSQRYDRGTAGERLSSQYPSLIFRVSSHAVHLVDLLL
ncbi:hypothetical protein [Roseivivax sp. CAU 1761]